MEAITTFGILARLIDCGLKTWDAIRAKGLDEKDIEALRSLLEAGDVAAKAQVPVAANAAARQMGVIAICFGRAFEQHWVGTRSLEIRGLKGFFSRGDREQRTEIELRLRLAGLTVETFGTRRPSLAEFDTVAALSTSPLNTPYYRALWDAFTNESYLIPEQLDGRRGDSPPLELGPTTRADFERFFLLAYRDALSGPLGKFLEGYVTGLQNYLKDLTRQLLVQDISSWSERHVFGNVRRENWPQRDPVPFLTLRDLYVEPDASLHKTAQIRSAPDVRIEPVLHLLRGLLDDPATRVMVVLGDFGTGKSLTARTLACELAAQYLASSKVSLDLPLPVFVRCASDFSDDAFDLEATVRRAWKRQCESFGLALSEDDSTFQVPSREQRTIFLLDGLDEVLLGARKLDALFQKLEGIATDKHKFIVFSRPGVMPSSSDRLKSTQVLWIRPLRHDPSHPEASQIASWLARWNRATPRLIDISAGALAERGLLDLARTPILLFMIALTWDRGGATGESSKAALYELFFCQIARGKADADQELHPRLGQASSELITLLRQRGELEGDENREHAMLWLMGAAAWQAARLQARGETLSRRDVLNLVHDELGASEEVAHCIEVGLLLALQADLRAGEDKILFGHQSFKEFLVARYWAQCLLKVAADPAAASDHTDKLLGGRLLGIEDKSFEFLMQIVNAEPSDGPFRWTPPLRDALVKWCERTFNDESIVGKRQLPRLRDDQRTPLREAALAIGSTTKGSPGIRAQDKRTLRTLYAWYFVYGEHPLIIANNAKLQGADLSSLELSGARFDGADLAGARLARSQMLDCSFAGASLRGARIAGATLFDCNFNDADLRGADLAHCSIVEPVLDRAKLFEVNMNHCYIHRFAPDAEIDFAGVRMHGSRYFEVDFSRVDLSRAEIKGGRYDKECVWPSGFDPSAHGLKLETQQGDDGDDGDDDTDDEDDSIDPSTGEVS